MNGSAINGSEEAKAVAAVADRLAGRFPEVPRDHVVELVNDAHLALEGNPIRDFVPVLVEHAARERLRAEGATPTPLPDEADAPAGPLIRVGEVPEETVFNARVALLNGGLGGGTS
jgi:hypothetical protein